MGKSLYIAEKPSVAQEFAKALKLNTRTHALTYYGYAPNTTRRDQPEGRNHHEAEVSTHRLGSPGTLMSGNQGRESGKDELEQDLDGSCCWLLLMEVRGAAPVPPS